MNIPQIGEEEGITLVTSPIVDVDDNINNFAEFNSGASSPNITKPAKVRNAGLSMTTPNSAAKKKKTGV